MAKKDTDTNDDKIKALEDRINQMQREHQDKMMEILSQPQTAAPAKADLPAMPEKPKLSLSGMPDSVTKPEEYQAELERRMETHFEKMDAYKRQLEAREDATAAAATPKDDVDPSALWTAYQEDYADYAKHEARVRTAASMAIEQMQKRGRDAQALMKRSPDLFFKEVNKVYDKEFGAPEPSGEAGGGKGSEEDDDETQRTAGLFGGQESGGRAQKGKKDEPASKFTDELKEYQDNLWQTPKFGAA